MAATALAALFQRMSVKTMSSERMYTSVHYVVNAGAGTKRTAEIQVRTLAEELWGEVDHTISYPHPCPIPTCGEQIKVLARVTSSCTRLVDSIFFARNQSEPKK
jgi:ppGpp synthetase/RelA/SpoT-type nucleotidyltranferase